MYSAIFEGYSFRLSLVDGPNHRLLVARDRGVKQSILSAQCLHFAAGKSKGSGHSPGYADKQKEKEEEANAFSSRTLLSQAEENEIIKQGDFSADTIRYYAEKFKVHPGIIVGRLQHRKVIPFIAHSTLIEKIELFN